MAVLPKFHTLLLASTGGTTQNSFLQIRSLDPGWRKKWLSACVVCCSSSPYGIAPCHGLEGPGCEPRWEDEVFSSQYPLKPMLGSTQPSLQCVPTAFVPLRLSIACYGETCITDSATNNPWESEISPWTWSYYAFTVQVTIRNVITFSFHFHANWDTWERMHQYVEGLMSLLYY